jgi:hypothetical protein
MILRIVLSFLLLHLVGCSSWDSKKFEPSQNELDAAAKISILQETDFVDSKKCQKIGNLKLLSFSKGQPANVVAIRKYDSASLVKHIASRIHGGLFGEGPTDFFDVYHCEK